MGTSPTQLWAWRTLKGRLQGRDPVLLVKGYAERCFSRTHQGALLSHYKSPWTQAPVNCWHLAFPKSGILSASGNT